MCGLSENGHQVIYTTHSDRMLDVFDTKGLIRLDMNDNNETEKRYNEVDQDIDTEIVDIERFNSFIKNIEPNLNKILFSKKVILVEGPNDLMVYKKCIEKKIIEKGKDKKFAETYLNFHNISIIAHHGKSTAEYLIDVCKHFKDDYFVINDWDFDLSDLDIEEVFTFSFVDELHTRNVYLNSDKKGDGSLRIWNLINKAGKDKIHFNVKKLETVIGYGSNDKNSFKIWEIINDDSFSFDESLFPDSLEEFLEFDKLLDSSVVDDSLQENYDDLPF